MDQVSRVGRLQAQGRGCTFLVFNSPGLGSASPGSACCMAIVTAWEQGRPGCVCLSPGHRALARGWPGAAAHTGACIGGSWGAEGFRTPSLLSTISLSCPPLTARRLDYTQCHPPGHFVEGDRSPRGHWGPLPPWGKHVTWDPGVGQPPWGAMVWLGLRGAGEGQ